MALIKYYNLESQSWKDVSDLERNLKKHLLDEQRTRAILGTDVEDIAEAKMGDGDKDTLAMLLYDSGDFDVLYKNSRTIANGKKRLFRENVAPRIGTELVVRARPKDILELQDYLGSSGFEVVEARGISRAVYTFHSECRTETTVDSGIKVYNKIFSGNDFELDFEFQKNEGNIGSTSGHALQGFVNGKVTDVLRARNILTCPGQDLPVFEEGVTFY